MRLLGHVHFFFDATDAHIGGMGGVMSGYLLSVIAAAVVVGVIGALAPAGEGDGLKKAVCFVGALCVLCVLIAPVGEFLGWLGNLGDGIELLWNNESAEQQYEQQYKDYLMSFGADSISEALAEHICQHFDIPEEQCHVRVMTGERQGELCVDSVTVILSGGALLRDPYEIENYISGLFDCRCTVTG